MPFERIYDVRFNNGNVAPGVNLDGWPDMELGGDQTAEFFPDESGMTVRSTRPHGATTTARANIFVAPPGGIPLNSRLRTRLIFDSPLAEWLDTNGNFSLAQPPHLPGVSIPQPEAWAVSLSFSARESLLDESALVNVTCQFNRTATTSGVRLNTPVPAGNSPLQSDASCNLETPLDYRRYAETVHLPLATFTLEHSFCGWNNRENRHTVGCGFLNIERLAETPSKLSDERLYSNERFHEEAPDGPIGALGGIVASRGGTGRYTAHFRRFTVWRNILC